MEPDRRRSPHLREVVFPLEAERPGHLEAWAETLPIRITAPTLEELQHEAREVLVAYKGPVCRPAASFGRSRAGRVSERLQRRLGPPGAPFLAGTVRAASTTAQPHEQRR